MFENTIEYILSHDSVTKKSFLGVFARDELPVIKRFPACFVVNTDVRSRPGQHWLAFYFDQREQCFFFDSYGMPPSFYRLESYIKRTTKNWTWNARRLQGLSQYCGFYSILFLLFIARNKKQNFFDNFSNNLFKNDNFIKLQIKKFSNKK
jgi:hypothetical protein